MIERIDHKLFSNIGNNRFENVSLSMSETSVVVNNIETDVFEPVDLFKINRIITVTFTMQFVWN